MPMSPLQALIMGILQGLTEFLPVSSSGHLVIVPWLLGWPTASLTFDTLVHWGTLLAVLLYFRRDVLYYLRAALLSLRRRSLALPGARLAWTLAVGSVPGVLAGLLLEDQFEALFHAPRYAAAFLLVTAALLLVSERLGRRTRDLSSVGFLDALVVGTAQALAITPGISRSGATIAAGLVRNLDRGVAARYSFLLGIPIIFGAGLFKLKDLFAAGARTEPPLLLAIGFLAAFISGYLAIGGLLRYLQTRTLYPFAAYTALFGLTVLLAVSR